MAVALKVFSEVTVSSGNTAVPLSATSYLVYGVSVQALEANTGLTYIGDSDVTADNGHGFGPGDQAEVVPPASPRGMEQVDLATIYINSATAGNKVRVMAWIRS